MGSLDNFQVRDGGDGSVNKVLAMRANKDPSLSPEHTQQFWAERDAFIRKLPAIRTQGP